MALRTAGGTLFTLLFQRAIGHFTRAWFEGDNAGAQTARHLKCQGDEQDAQNLQRAVTPRTIVR